MPKKKAVQIPESIESMVCDAFAEVIEQRVAINVVTTLKAIEQDLSHACELALGAQASRDKPKECADWFRQIADSLIGNGNGVPLASCITIPDSSVEILRHNELVKAKSKLVKLLSSKDAPSNA